MKRKIFLRVFSIFLICLVLLPMFSLVVLAANSFTIENIETSSINDDMKRLEAFKEKSYGKDEAVDYCEVFEFIEYGYNAYGQTGEYGLYLYLYNPSGKKIDYSNLYKNKIQFRVAPSDEKEAGDDSNKYEWLKVSLKHLDHTDDFLMYKFKLDIPNSFMNKPDKNKRIYEISDIEITYDGERNAKSVGSGGKWIYVGYMDGRGPAGTPLRWESTNLVTLELELHQSSWRTDTSEKGIGWAYELSSVFFSVPNSVIKEYGDPTDPYKGLVEVKGTYDNRKIRGISTTNNEFYNEMRQWIGYDCNESNVPFGFLHLNSRASEIGEFGFNRDGFFQLKYTLLDSYNPYYVKTDISKFGNPFKGTIEGLDNKSLEAQIEDYIDYNRLLTAQGTYSQNYYTVTNKDEHGNVIDISKNMVSLSAKNGKWNIFDGIFLGIPKYENESYSEISPITVVNSVDMPILDSEVCNKYYVGEEYVSDLRNCVNENKLSTTTFLMRFALTDYFCDEIIVARSGGGNDMQFGEGNYFFEKEIFLNFDILSLTWENENKVRTVLPVTASPINIVGSVTPDGDANGGIDKVNGDKVDNNTNSGLFSGITKQQLIIIIVSVLIIVVLCIIFPSFRKVIGAVFTFIGKILLLPIKVIAFLLEKIFVPLREKKILSESKDKDLKMHEAIELEKQRMKNDSELEKQKMRDKNEIKKQKMKSVSDVEREKQRQKGKMEMFKARVSTKRTGKVNIFEKEDGFYVDKDSGEIFNKEKKG